jgi:hypothetical protein
LAQINLKCFSCGKEMSFVDMIGRRDECPHCHADARVCKNCQFYDSKAYNECHETSAEVVREKERSNVCDFFQPGSKFSEATSRDALRAAAEALFKKN